MVAKKSRKPAAKTSGGQPLLEAITARMKASLLPGDTEFPAELLREAARFVAETAQDRTPGKPAIQIASASEERRFTRIAIVNDDMPFLVDSIANAIASLGIAIDRLVHPIIPVERDARSQLQTIPEGEPEGVLYESMIYIETDRVDAKQRRMLSTIVRETLEDVRAAVSDWGKLQRAMQQDAQRCESTESTELLEWLEHGMLTQLGHVIRHRDGTYGKALGICRKSAKEILADASFERAFAYFEQGDAPGRDLLIIKANRLSNVHRRVPLDLFIVPVRTDGKITALSVHAGVWTSAALQAPPRSVPRLRRQLETLFDDLDFDHGSHAGKALVHAFTALPHDLLIAFSDRNVARVVTTMMSLVDRPRPRLSLVEAPLARHLFAFVWIPRDMLATRVRLQIQALLEQESGARLLDWSLEVEGGNLAMLRFVLDLREFGNKSDEAAIEQRLQSMLRGWPEAIENELAIEGDPGRAAALATRYAEYFPGSYRAEYGAGEAARDIVRLRALQPSDQADAAADTGRRDARLYHRDGDPADHLRLKLYQAQGSLPLSDAVPTLENFGFRVNSEIPTVLDEGRVGTIHDFHLELPENTSAQTSLDRSETIERAVAAVLNGAAENDVFNRLVVGARLQANEANWLRAFYRYLRQAGMGFTIYTVVDALNGAPDVTRALIDLFVARHDPQFSGSREKAIDSARERIRKGLTNVQAINDDRLLRLNQSLIEAILRTNAFAPAAGEALAFKIDSAMVPNLPMPLPWREIFVYSRRVEGIHLRAGAIARGGIRWSDRRDDFRTEVLGLMKAQRVKNAVIVPTGAKGGFYPKQLPSPSVDREGWAAEGQASYEVFIRSLLSITDNIVDDKVVHPDNIAILDGEDPYFVVAADKGTARFSDVANAIAENRDFWLDDAFASGGSHGYDHKEMAITARGAWISVQRHFRELGIDVQTETVRVAGCGDMSGDVFGNGMLLSKAIKLVAAFDHRDIFIDPDPDPAASWAERKRMFDLPRSSWADYDTALISRGGGVFSRTAKSITLSKTAQASLGIDDAELKGREIEPDALISAILRAPVDLFWFGGIGTYVKAASENNIQVGDPANDPLRVDGEAVRARVIGEGANLGVTQAGRIEFARRGNGGTGGRINTDFIDNSAGVDCSDNEVNIKIALAAAQRAGKLSEERRNRVLESMTEEVAQIVLEDNFDQALALSIAQTGGAKSIESHLHLIETLEGRQVLDRRTEGLADSETLIRRAAEGSGLTRPELAVLLSSSKLVLQDAIEGWNFALEGPLKDLLFHAFPEPMRKDFAKQITEHRLRRELIATKLANRIVNRLGIVHPFEIAEEEGVPLEQVAASYIIVERLFNIDALWESIEAAKMEERARLLLLDHLAIAMRSQIADLLRLISDISDPAAIIETLSKGVHMLAEATDELLAAENRQRSEKLEAKLKQEGAPEKLARQVGHLFDMDGALGLAHLANDVGIDPRKLTTAFTLLGTQLGLDWAQGTAAMMNPSDVWERLLVAGLARDFQQMRLTFIKRLAGRKNGRKDIEAGVTRWIDDNAAAVRQFRAMTGRAQTEPQVTAPMLAQIASMARNLLAR